jgi:hypothetical protein
MMLTILYWLLADVNNPATLCFELIDQHIGMSLMQRTLQQKIANVRCSDPPAPTLIPIRAGVDPLVDVAVTLHWLNHPVGISTQSK